MKKTRIQSPWRRTEDIDKAVKSFAAKLDIQSQNAAVNVLIVMQLQSLGYKV